MARDFELSACYVGRFLRIEREEYEDEKKERFLSILYDIVPTNTLD